MKLSRLYCNKPDFFGPIDFRDGINVILAEIRLPENQGKDTHNLGKSTLSQLLDFMFLLGKDPAFFLFKHFDHFKDFVFYLEIEVEPESYLTIRRSIGDATRIAFLRHLTPGQDYSTAPDSAWSHTNVPFERAKELLDGLLGWQVIKPWSYRKEIGYLLRSQEDYRDVFHIKKAAFAHSDWKPFLASLIGFDGSLVAAHYKLEDHLADLRNTATLLRGELPMSVEDVGKIDGLLLLKEADAAKKQQLLNAFDFRSEDKQKTKVLVDDIDSRISELNSQRYSLQRARKKVVVALQEDQILFDPSEAKKLFEEAGVTFADSLRKDFEQLIAFNKAITAERQGYLLEERSEIDLQLKQISSELNTLGKRRADALSFLSATDAFEKYRAISDELVTIRADLISLGRQRDQLHRLSEIRSDIRRIDQEIDIAKVAIEADVVAQNSNSESRFSKLRIHFSDFIDQVIDRKALLSVSLNREGHLDFSAEILGDSGQSTSADFGHTYRKLLCIAFDLAVLRAHIQDRFPRFVYHDGVFESLDDRKKLNLMRVVRDYASLGLQPMITLIDSDISHLRTSVEPMFDESEIVVRLHDEGDAGRLFRLPSW